jgi:hypothetical protein
LTLYAHGGYATFDRCYSLPVEVAPHLPVTFPIVLQAAVSPLRAEGRASPAVSADGPACKTPQTKERRHDEFSARGVS